MPVILGIEKLLLWYYKILVEEKLSSMIKQPVLLLSCFISDVPLITNTTISRKGIVLYIVLYIHVTT